MNKNDEKDQIICQLYVAGCARSEISMKVGVSIPTIDTGGVTRWLRARLNLTYSSHPLLVKVALSRG